MKRPTFALALLLCIGSPIVAWAEGALSYDDPSIHFAAPEGWTRVEVEPGDPNSAAEQPVAVFQKAAGRNDTRVITLKIGRYEGTLDGLATNHQSDLRSGGQGVFIDKKTRITMPNGMPAWQIRYSFGQDVGQAVRALETVVYDGRRSIVLTYAGRAGSFDDAEAQQALSSFTVVLYPEGR